MQGLNGQNISYKEAFFPNTVKDFLDDMETEISKNYTLCPVMML
jgi:hypothetical protein